MNFKKFIKKNSVPLMIFVLLLMIVVAVLLFIGMFVPSNKNGVYGNRLDNIEDYPIESATWKEVETLALSNEGFTKVTTSLKGRIVYIHLYTSTLDREAAKEAGEVVFDAFSDAQKSYYDFQLVLRNESEEEGASYTMYGARNHGALETKWTNYSEGGSNEE